MRWEVLLKQNIVIAITIKQINRIEVLTIGATVFIFQELILLLTITKALLLLFDTLSLTTLNSILNYNLIFIYQHTKKIIFLENHILLPNSSKNIRRHHPWSGSLFSSHLNTLLLDKVTILHYFLSTFLSKTFSFFCAERRKIKCTIFCSINKPYNNPSIGGSNV